jgi:predicted small secreted protein
MKDRVMAWMSLNGPTVGTVALIVVAVVMITGCNTIAGMGTDINKSAEWTKDKMSGNKNSSTTQTGAAK